MGVLDLICGNCTNYHFENTLIWGGTFDHGPTYKREQEITSNRQSSNLALQFRFFNVTRWSTERGLRLYGVLFRVNYSHVESTRQTDEEWRRKESRGLRE